MTLPFDWQLWTDKELQECKERCRRTVAFIEQEEARRLENRAMDNINGGGDNDPAQHSH